MDSQAKPLAVQLSPYPEPLLDQLGLRVNLVDLTSMDTDATAEWLGEHGARVTIVVTSGRYGLPPAVAASCPALKLVAIYGVGFDKVDVDACRRRGIAVTNTPDVLTDDVADLAVGLIIALLRRIPAADHHARGGAWANSEFPLGRRVTGKTFGIIGLGHIGRAIAERLSPFGPVAYTGTRPKDVGWTYHETPASLAKASDILIVACAANERTRGLVDADVLNALGPAGWLVNIARGAIVDEEALAKAMASGLIAGAALDVFREEPAIDGELKSSAATVLTPHIGSATFETRAAMADALVANIDAYLAGCPLPGALPVS